MQYIDGITATEVKDSRGNPTVMVTLRSGDYEVNAKVPSGRSAGAREALELRDADGSGVAGAIGNVNSIIRDALRGIPLDPPRIDRELIALDATKNKSRLGANAILGVSLAAVRLAAKANAIPLWRYIAETSGNMPAMPRLYMNMLNGGAHASFCLPFQEYIVVVGGARASEAYESAKRIFARLEVMLKRDGVTITYGDEGGYAPEFPNLEAPFNLLAEASHGTPDTFLAIDAAASEFFQDGAYHILDTSYSSDELVNIYTRLIREYDLRSIEDPFDENDLSAYEAFTARAGTRTLVVGDDLTVTNPHITAEMITKKRANAMIVKPNQVGTLSEVFAVAKAARAAGWQLIASHRSGETDDHFIADLAVGIGAYGVKAGAPTQHERRVKYERLLEIEKELYYNEQHI